MSAPPLPTVPGYVTAPHEARTLGLRDGDPSDLAPIDGYSGQPCEACGHPAASHGQARDWLADWCAACDCDWYESD